MSLRTELVIFLRIIDEFGMGGRDRLWHYSGTIARILHDEAKGCEGLYEIEETSRSI